MFTYHSLGRFSSYSVR